MSQRTITVGIVSTNSLEVKAIKNAFKSSQHLFSNSQLHCILVKTFHRFSKKYSKVINIGQIVTNSQDKIKITLEELSVTTNIFDVMVFVECGIDVSIKKPMKNTCISLYFPATGRKVNGFGKSSKHSIINSLMAKFGFDLSVQSELSQLIREAHSQGFFNFQ